MEIWDITLGMATPTKLVSATQPLGTHPNGAFTIDFATRVEEDSVDIFVLAPNNGLAAYRLIFTPDWTGWRDVQEDDMVQVYDLQGRLLYSGNHAEQSWRERLQPGIYIVAERDKKYKICF